MKEHDRHIELSINVIGFDPNDIDRLEQSYLLYLSINPVSLAEKDEINIGFAAHDCERTFRVNRIDAIVLAKTILAYFEK